MSSTPWVISSPALDHAQALMALLLLGAALVGLPYACLRAWAFWRGEPGADRQGLLVAGAMVVAGALRWLVYPRLIATMFIGYKMTQEAWELFPVSHYGIGAAAFYHALFGFLPYDHATIMWANSVMGVLTLPLLAATVARLFDDRRAGAVVAALVAVTPMFVRNDNSDANNVPVLLWLFAGLSLWLEYLVTRRRAALLAALPLLTLAIISRPEMPVLVPLLGLGCALARGQLRFALRDPWFWALAVPCAALTVPHLLHVRNAIHALNENNNLPGAHARTLPLLPYLLLARGAVFMPTLYPVTLPLLAIVPFVRRRVAGLAPFVVLGVLFVIALGLYVLDEDSANRARIHVPAGMLLGGLAAAGLVRLWDTIGARWWARGILLVAVAGSMLPSARRLWAPTNEAAEEALVRQTQRDLPEDAFTLIRMEWPDKDRGEENHGHTHFHFPDYLFLPPARPGRVRSISEWEQQPDWVLPAFFFQGFRCYAQFRSEDQPAPSGANFHPLCARMHEVFKLEPVFEHELPNRGNVWINYYGDSPTLQVGLYRVLPRS